jgi:hypothetical protein
VGESLTAPACGRLASAARAPPPLQSAAAGGVFISQRRRTGRPVLALIFSASPQAALMHFTGTAGRLTEHEKAAKLVRVNELCVRRDPDSDNFRVNHWYP